MVTEEKPIDYRRMYEWSVKGTVTEVSEVDYIFTISPDNTVGSAGMKYTAADLSHSGEIRIFCHQKP